MAQLTCLPESGTKPVSLRCTDDGVLLVKMFVGEEHEKWLAGQNCGGNYVPPQNCEQFCPPDLRVENPPPPPNPILGINPSGELQAVAVDEFGRLMIHDAEGQKSLRESVKRIKGLANAPSTPRFHSLALCGEFRSLILEPNAEPSIAFAGPVVLIHLSARNNTSSTVVLKIRFRTKSKSGEILTELSRIDREMSPCESFDMPFQAGVALHDGTSLEASAVASQDDSTAKKGINGISLALHFVRV